MAFCFFEGGKDHLSLLCMLWKYFESLLERFKCKVISRLGKVNRTEIVQYGRLAVSMTLFVAGFVLWVISKPNCAHCSFLSLVR